MAETKPKCEITIDAADVPDHALNQLPVVIRECERLMGEHGYDRGHLGRGNIGKWSLSLVKNIEVELCFYILVNEQPQFTVESFDRRVLEDEEPNL